MDQKTKIKILRLYEKNPGIALIHALEEIYSDLLNAEELKGKKGDKGDTITPPTKEEILKEVFDYLKKNPPKDGRTPTTDEILKIIQPLIPKVKDGKTPTLKEILPAIQKVVTRYTGESEKKLKSYVEEVFAKIKDQPVASNKEETPDDLVRKINSVEESIDPKTIKGLTIMLANFQRSLREKGGAKGGGGMGNTQHESKSVSSATTSVVTNSKIGANGYAIWAYYQGQMIVRGTHYTVGADRKTLSLLFTPQDGQTIDLIYIRS